MPQLLIGWENAYDEDSSMQVPMSDSSAVNACLSPIKPLCSGILVLGNFRRRSHVCQRFFSNPAEIPNST